MVGDVSESVVIKQASAARRDLAARVVSGLTMGAVALACNWVDGLVFALLVGSVGLAMSWEWGRIVRRAAVDRLLLVHGLAVISAILVTAAGRPALAIALVAVGTVMMAVFRPSRASRCETLMSALGVLYVGVPAIALVWLRTADSYGALAILFLFVIVWTTDSSAYGCGRNFGGPKLWPALSPHKTWAGTLGGIGAAAVAGLVFGWLTGNPGSAGLLACSILLSLATQLGDLAESALKRAYALDATSQLIPGHGGVMDRMDGLAAAATVAAALAALKSIEAPARALLVWT